MTAGYRIVIPARMASQRLPGKPLLPINGRTLIEHVYRRALESSAQSVVIATDSDEIRSAAAAFGAEAVMTSGDHESGSDRIAECIDIMGWSDETLVVNLQGDEPLMPPACLDQVAGILHKAPEAAVASLYWPIESAQRRRGQQCGQGCHGQHGESAVFQPRSDPLSPQRRYRGGAAAGIRPGIGISGFMPTVPVHCEPSRPCRSARWNAWKNWSN